MIRHRIKPAFQRTDHSGELIGEGASPHFGVTGAADGGRQGPASFRRQFDRHPVGRLPAPTKPLEPRGERVGDRDHGRNGTSIVADLLRSVTQEYRSPSETAT